MRGRSRFFATAVFALLALCPLPGVSQTPYGGPLIDAHSHLPNLQVLDAYAEAIKRHNVAKVLSTGTPT